MLPGIFSKIREQRTLRRGLRFLNNTENIIQRDAFTGQSILIIGPADTVEDDLAALGPGHEQIIIRLNKAHSLPLDGPSRTDILFHNFTMAGERAAGTLRPADLKIQGVKTIVYPHAEPRRITNNILRTKAQLEQHGIRVLFPSPDLYLKLLSALNGSRPTTGAVSIAVALAGEPSSLSIAGFTFFTTGYKAAYHSGIRTGKESFEWATASGLHDPYTERLLVRRLIDDAQQRHRTIRLGPGVKNALYRYPL